MCALVVVCGQMALDTAMRPHLDSGALVSELTGGLATAATSVVGIVAPPGAWGDACVALILFVTFYMFYQTRAAARKLIDTKVPRRVTWKRGG